MEGNVQVPQASRTNIRVTAETGSKELIVKASSDFFPYRYFLLWAQLVTFKNYCGRCQERKTALPRWPTPMYRLFFGIVS